MNTVPRHFTLSQEDIETAIRYWLNTLEAPGEARNGSYTITFKSKGGAVSVVAIPDENH